MGELAPSLTYHYWGMGYDDSSKGMKVLTRGKDFDHQKKITFEDDEVIYVKEEGVKWLYEKLF